MEEIYNQHGVRFVYPDDWEVTEEKRDDELSITVSSPHASFWTLTLFYDSPDPEDIIETVLEAFRDEYQELDIYPADDEVCDCPTVARDIEFVCLELLNSAWARSFQTPDFTGLVLYQATDHEQEQALPVFETLTASLECGSVR